MILEKNCYLCKYLIFFGSETLGDYYCTINNVKYTKETSDLKCTNFCQEYEQ